MRKMFIRPFNQFLLFCIVISGVVSCDKKEVEPKDEDILQVQSVRVGANALSQSAITEDMPVDQPIVVAFTISLDRNSVETGFILVNEQSAEIPLQFSFLDQDKTVSARPVNELDQNALYTLRIGKVRSAEGVEFEGADYTFRTKGGILSLQSIAIGSQALNVSARIVEVALMPEIRVVFSHPPNENSALSSIQITTGAKNTPVDIKFENDGSIAIIPQDSLEGLTRYEFVISDELVSNDNRVFEGFSKSFYTQIDSVFQFPVIQDDELLTLVQRQTFKYFWDFAHPQSGMARERNTSGDLVTSGGSGFGIMAIIVGIERGFIEREEGISRMEKVVTFLETADRFHGAWSHWINGVTGKVIPFSQKDNGGDLVETSFLIQGLIAFRQYLNQDDPREAALRDRIHTLWESVEWNWYTKDGEKTLYWHWSPDFEWEMNHRIRGYNEALITYVLAASSPAHAISTDVYHEGWAGNGSIENGKEYYGILLPLGFDYGGPLFFAHYSFMGLDPRKLEDQYANYWTQNVNHTLINRSYAIDNPRNNAGYSENVWGLTASDNQDGYSAHSPTNDLGVITPTAAISSIPFTPDYSLDAIRTFYYFLGDRLWGPYGFYDAFNPTAGWYANSYLAIDQGPIIVMIENYRTGLLWELFMSAPEIKAGLTKLGFTY